MKIIHALSVLLFSIPLVVYSQAYNLGHDTYVSQETSVVLEAIDVPEPSKMLITKHIVPDDTLYAIGTCESRHTQFQKDGTVLRGKINHHDVGEYQINEYWNGEDAKKLGFDIYTQQGNEAYAVWLYNKKGTTPWKASSNCWEPMLK